MDLEAHSVPGFFCALGGVFRGVHYNSDADGLIIVVDCDDTQPHSLNHETPEGRSDRCRLCQASEIIAKTRKQLKARSGRPRDPTDRGQRPGPFRRGSRYRTDPAQGALCLPFRYCCRLPRVGAPGHGTAGDRQERSRREAGGRHDRPRPDAHSDLQYRPFHPLPRDHGPGAGGSCSPAFSLASGAGEEEASQVPCRMQDGACRSRYHRPARRQCSALPLIQSRPRRRFPHRVS